MSMIPFLTYRREKNVKQRKTLGKNKGNMFLTLALWFFFGYIIFMFGESLNSASFLGYPLAYYMCAQGSIVAFVIILFWSANRQEK